jgi:hypothetical protein
MDMAVGDTVSGMSAVGADLTFQPAASISVMITSFTNYTVWCRITDGTLSALAYNNTSASGGPWSTKIIVDNTNYLKIDADTVSSAAYSGIQIT